MATTATKKQVSPESPESSDDTGAADVAPPASKSGAAGKKTAKKAASKKAAKKAASKKAAKKKVAKKSAAKKASKKAAKKKSAAKKKASGDATGKQLVVVESPAKAKTINKYLGPDFVVRASVGHVRDLPSKAPKGTKMPVPGVDLDNGFAPTYEVLSAKAKTVRELQKEAAMASQVWFATDLDREGEAIAWHLAEIFGIDPLESKRVVFNAITQDEISRAFSQPRTIDLSVVHAQQARRILDRIVGYQASPLLWKKVARGLSAGRVQSVAVRIVVEREREIEAFVPDETWRFTGRFATAVDEAARLRDGWSELMAQRDDKGKPPTQKLQNAWMTEQAALRGELVEFDGSKFELGCSADKPEDLSDRAVAVAKACGLTKVEATVTENPEGRGPARYERVVTGELDPDARYRVRSIESRKTSSRPSAPFITSSLQIAASNTLGYAAQRTMRLAQDLYEGVELAGRGEVGLITYMRTDSTHLSTEAIDSIRGYVQEKFGEEYLPEKPNVYTSSNKDAQEAHEAIRPTDPTLDPETMRAQLKGPRAEEQYKLYKLIWARAVGCQMMPARWNSTAITLERSDVQAAVAFRSSGRILAFDGFYKAVGVPTASDEQVLPPLNEGDELAPFAILPQQKFSNPPPRFSEASLVKALESDGIGRPSTYASIIQVIQDRNYVEQLDRRFHSTDLGEVVTDKLIEAFPDLMNVGYTREMELQLDEVEASRADWVSMLQQFYGSFSEALELAHEAMSHAKAEIQPARYKCPECGSKTCYRFGKNGRFLSCTAYPDCNYAAPIDRRGRPMLPERVDIACPLDGSGMELRNGRFGQFIASVNYPEVNFVLNLDKKGCIKYPAIPPLVVEDLECPKCESPMNLRRGKRGPWLGCSKFPKCRGRLPWNSLEDARKDELERELTLHEGKHPPPKIARRDGTAIPEGTPIGDLAIVGGLAELEIHPEAEPETVEEKATG